VVELHKWMMMGGSKEKREQPRAIRSFKLTEFGHVTCYP
jgi:hypothetical protein